MTLSNNSNTNFISINGKSVQRIFYKGIPVVTLGMMDELHGREPGTAKRNFQANRDKLILGEDYFEVPHDTYKGILTGRNSSRQDSDLRNIIKNEHGGYRGDMIFLTLTGYMMLVKSFTDDLAWKIQRELVNFYFNKSTNTNQLLQAGATITESIALMKEKMKILKMEDELERLSKKLAHKVLENEVSFETYDSVPIVKMAVSAAMEKDPRFKQMELF